MAKRTLLTYEERMNWKERYFKKVPIPRAVRMTVAKRYGGEAGKTVPAWCVYCGDFGEVCWYLGAKGQPTTHITFGGLELDHVIPEVEGGSNRPENIVLACRPCNRKRGHKGKYQPSISFPPPYPEAMHG